MSFFPYRDGTTHVIFEPMDFIARLVALVPKPGAHLTRFHGVFAPHSALRAQVVPKKNADADPAPSQKTDVQRHRAMTWAARLKRVFAIEIARCRRCGGTLRVIASIEKLPSSSGSSITSTAKTRHSIPLTRAGRRRNTSYRSDRSLLY